MSVNDWTDYQEKAAAFFRQLGFDAQTNISIQGSRTKHAVDVLVRLQQAGFEVSWIVECKLWNSRVSKLHVLALRTIVLDTGVDRGILLCEAGFQAGAMEAASMSNVWLGSLEDLGEKAKQELLQMKVANLLNRVDSGLKKYWTIPKGTRIEMGLRPDPGTSGYSTTATAKTLTETLNRALRGAFPFTLDRMAAAGEGTFEQEFRDLNHVVEVCEPFVIDMEEKIRTVSDHLA